MHTRMLLDGIIMHLKFSQYKNKTMTIEGTLITADEGKLLRRKADQLVYGKSVNLGYTYYLHGAKLVTPFQELPEHFEEIDAPADEGQTIEEGEIIE